MTKTIVAAALALAASSSAVVPAQGTPAFAAPIPATQTPMAWFETPHTVGDAAVSQIAAELPNAAAQRRFKPRERGALIALLHGLRTGRLRR